MARLLVTLLAVLALAGLAAGCGGESGGDESAAETWADEVCGAVATWRDDLTAIATDFGGGISRDAFADKVDEAAAATETLVDDLRAIGAPDTPAGEQAKEELDAFADTAEQSLEDIQAEAEQLGDAGVAGFLQGVVTIAGEIDDLVAEGRQTIEDLQALDAGEELKDAITGSSACSDLAGG